LVVVRQKQLVGKREAEVKMIEYGKANEQPSKRRAVGRPRKPLPEIPHGGDASLCAYKTGPAAEYLGLDYESLLALIHSGELPAVRITRSRSGRFLIPRLSIERYLANHPMPRLSPDRGKGKKLLELFKAQAKVAKIEWDRADYAAKKAAKVNEAST
jgi:excisionase family DNA binding protein